MDYQETKVLLHELEQLYLRDDDIKDMLDIRKMQREIEVQCELKLKDAKEIIKVMTSEVSAKESEIKAPSQSDHAANLKRISNKENLLQQIDTISRNIDTKRQNIAKMSTTTFSLKERGGEFNLSTEMADSRTAYAISLYAKISNISWDYKSASGHLTGYIGDDTKKELSKFDLDTRSLSSFDLANRLWALIGQQHSATADDH